MVSIKKLPNLLFALIALFGIINCTVIEPALAQMDSHHAEFSGEEEAHCDFISCSFHHIWQMPASESVSFQPLQLLGITDIVFSKRIDPPLKGIFHPPLVLA